MNYLDPSEYGQFGLDPAADDMWTAAASALMDAHCRRPTLGPQQYTERFRMQQAQAAVRLSYLPLLAVAPAASPIVSLRGRYATSRALDGTFRDLAYDAALAFALPGSWTSLDTNNVDLVVTTGEISVQPNIFGLAYSEIEVTYTAGLDVIPPAVKHACAQIVRNAQATPALNVKVGRLDQMRIDYFAPTLLDQSVRKMLAPYVAQRMQG